MSEQLDQARKAGSRLQLCWEGIELIISTRARGNQGRLWVSEVVYGRCNSSIVRLESWKVFKPME